MHLIIDGYGNDASLMEDEKAIYDILDHYPAVIGMNKVSPPYVVRYVGPNPDDWGLSGFVIIAESHISIHTFVPHRYINIDVFSCREFDTERVIQDFRRLLQLDRFKTYLIKRGVEYLKRGAFLLFD